MRAVFDGFHELVQSIESHSAKGDDKSRVLLDSMLRWAVTTAQIHNLAHVVFVSDSIASPSLFFLSFAVWL